MFIRRDKRTLILAILAIYASFSWGSDSTVPAFNSALTPSVSSNQPFLLDSGYADISNIQTTNVCATPNSDGTIPPGYVWITSSSSAGTGAPFAIRTTICTNPHLCPTNFNPVVIITPYKSLGQGNESMRACVDSVSGPDGIRYWFGVWVNTIANSNGNLVPATSYYWSVYCYPVSTYGTTNNPSAISGTSSNLCGPSINTYAPAVLIWDSGSISFPVVNSENQTLNTNRVCPDSYTPYLTITSSYQWSPGPASQSQTGGGNKATVSATRMYLGHGICVSGLQGTNGGQYTFNYLVNKTYFRMSNFYSSSLYLWSKDSSGVVSAGGYNRPSAGILQPDGTVDGNGNFSSATYQTAPTDVGGIQWTLYCYPQGYTPPSYDTSYCKIGATPF